MKARVPVIVKDPEVAEYKDLPYWEEYTLEEDVLLDGPVSRRVAVLDFDESGRLAPGTNFVPGDGKSPGRYEIGSLSEQDAGAFSNWDFLRAAVFGGVYKVLSMFEESDTLGRRVRWAFPGPQLLVVPRAGEWGNAYYERESRSLQFFYLTRNGRRIYTSHSQDVIGHETAHAVIDGIAPDLYDATTPESLAIHEALADITTVLLAFRSRKLAARVLEQTGGSIEHSSAFTRVAEQFGAVISGGRHDFLRDLNNGYTLRDPGIDVAEPHSLSQVLSGALYSLAVAQHEELKAEASEASENVADEEVARWQKKVATGELAPLAQMARTIDRGTPPGKALFLAGERLKRMALRALDYLPPGDVSFADYGRAVYAADQASHPDTDMPRQRFAEEFVRRGIVGSIRELEIETDMEHRALKTLDLDELVASDWVAYRFANQQRKWLGIPPRIPFEIRPRLLVEKDLYHSRRAPGGREEVPRVRELIMKVGWTETEAMSSGAGLPRTRRISCGITLVLDGDTKRVRALLRTGPPEKQTGTRDEFVRRLAESDILRIGATAKGPDGRILRGVVPAEITGGALRLRNAARMLHVVEGW